MKSARFSAHLLWLVGSLSIASHAASLDSAPVAGSGMLAQAGGSVEERIRGSAGRMTAYRKLLVDPDANVRLAALDEMIKSNDAAVRELAFESGFSSADSTLRALTLRGRLMATKTLVFELVNSKNLPAEDWEKSLKTFGSDRQVIHNLEVNPATNDVKFNGGTGRLSGQELTLTYANGSMRLRLSDGAVMVGTSTYHGVTLPVRLVLQ